MGAYIHFKGALFFITPKVLSVTTYNRQQIEQRMCTQSSNRIALFYTRFCNYKPRRTRRGKPKEKIIGRSQIRHAPGNYCFGLK
jgi:hypothetical protein